MDASHFLKTITARLKEEKHHFIHRKKIFCQIINARELKRLKNKARLLIPIKNDTYTSL